jgi:hypothetical protein
LDCDIPYFFLIGPTISVTYSNGNLAYLFTATVYARDRFGFSYIAYGLNVANPSQCFLAGDPHTLDYIAFGDA